MGDDQGCREVRRFGDGAHPPCLKMLNQNGEKRVKFNELNDSEDEGGNDLDLDTIRASSKNKTGLKEFDSEGSEDELGKDDDDDVEQYDFDSESDESYTLSAEEDERQVPLTPFNLKEDREEGNFDSDGFYTRKHDEEADQDRWMTNLTKSDMIKARKAHEKQQEMKRMKKEDGGKGSEKELWKELAGLLEENDMTVLEVIREMSVKLEGQKPRAPLNKNRLKKLEKEQQQQPVRLNSENNAKMERLTELADALMDFGNFGVYEETRRSILRKLDNKN